MSTVLCCEGVSRIYGDAYALVDVSTQLVSGRAKALLGPNGAGKSTLLGVCSSKLATSEGVVRFHGQPIEEALTEFRTSLGLVSHQLMLYGQLSGKENLLFFARAFGVDKPEDVVPFWLDKVGLSWASERPVDEYSRGMKQRLTIARALLHQPSLLLLDEPFTGLDRAGVNLATELFVAAKTNGAALLVSSHDLSALDALTDEALVLTNGRVVHDGLSDEPLGTLYGRVVEGVQS